MVREATREDAQVIGAILELAFAPWKHRYPPEAYAVTTPRAAQVVQRLGEGPIWLDGEPATGTLSGVVRSDELYLRALAVLPNHQGSGAAKRLLQTAQEYAGKHHLRRLILSTAPFLEPAIKLYQKCGFTPCPGPTSLHGLPLINFEKTMQND